MMSFKLLIFLIIGTFAMFGPIATISKYYKIRLWKAIVFTVLLTLTGTFSTNIMYYIENRGWGLSFYGAVFFVPIWFLYIAIALKIPYRQAMDMCAVGECIMVALMRVHCIISGCCIGRPLLEKADGEIIRFPSRIAEMITALIIFSILLRWFSKEKYHGLLYPWFLMLYGGTRFVLNFVRDEWQKNLSWIPMGTVWSIIAVVLGVGIILLYQRKYSVERNRN